MLTLGAWLHDLDPFVWRISEGFGIRWYGLAYVAGFVAAWVALAVMAKRKLICVRAEAVPDLIIAVVLGTLVGGRVGYALFYRPELFVMWLDHAPWWGMFAINEGGMASHGGLVGVLVACIWFARREKISVLATTDVLTLVGPIGVFFGRVANFINGELLGAIVARPGAAGPWWSVRYPQELLDRPPELTDAQFMQLQELLYAHAQEGDTEVMATSRMLDALRAGEAGLAEQLAPLISARHPSQLYQAFAEGLAVLGVLWCCWVFVPKMRRPGVMSALFLIVYGIGRVATEVYRLPDAHLVMQRIAGLSRGQWLSVAMVLAGGVMLWVISRRGDAGEIAK